MRHLFFILIGIILFFSASYAGFSVFSMHDGMVSMASLECVNHCIDLATVPGAIPSVLSFFVFISFLFFREILRFAQDDKIHIKQFYQRLTEPIRLFFLTKTLSSVLIRD